MMFLSFDQVAVCGTSGGYIMEQGSASDGVSDLAVQ